LRTSKGKEFMANAIEGFGRVAVAAMVAGESNSRMPALEADAARRAPEELATLPEIPKRFEPPEA